MERLTRWDEVGQRWTGAKRGAGDYVGDQEIIDQCASYENSQLSHEEVNRLGFLLNEQNHADMKSYEMVGILDTQMTWNNSDEARAMKCYETLRHAQWLMLNAPGLIKEVQGYRDAEKSGLTVRLPCKVGDTVYMFNHTFMRIAPYVIQMIQIYGHTNMDFCAIWNDDGECMDEIDFDVDDIGKTVFLTQEDAVSDMRYCEPTEEEPTC